MTLPKSVTPARILSNLNGGVEAAARLTKEDIDRLDNLAPGGKQKRFIMPPWGKRPSRHLTSDSELEADRPVLQVSTSASGIGPVRFRSVSRSRTSMYTENNNCTVLVVRISVPPSETSRSDNRVDIVPIFLLLDVAWPRGTTPHHRAVAVSALLIFVPELLRLSRDIICLIMSEYSKHARSAPH